MLNKCLKCREPGHRSSDYHLKNLNLVEAKVSKIELNNVENGDDEEALELEANEGATKLYYIEDFISIEI